MGLDMYLTGKKYINNYEPQARALSAKIGQALGLPAETARVVGVSVEIGYWRKVNPIHKWFVDTVQDGEDVCNETWVSRKQLADLTAACTLVIKDPTQAAVVLPTEAGFFFGSTEYDEDYADSLEYTVKVCEKAVKMLDEGFEVYYQSSW